jgi:hypothetical protein
MPVAAHLQAFPANHEKEPLVLVYQLASQAIALSHALPALDPFLTSREVQAFEQEAKPHGAVLDTYDTLGWIAGREHRVKISTSKATQTLKVSGACDVVVASGGKWISARTDRQELSFFESQIILGPALVLALALNQKWSLHASAVQINGQNIAFLGESGQGKSTLAAYLDNQGMQRIADDILPVQQSATGIDALPHFPQLKLPADAQPGLYFPERLALHKLFLLESADERDEPALNLLPPNNAIQVPLRHTAGTRLFTADLLKKHLGFSAFLARHIPIYTLIYPHRRDALPVVKKLLEALCVS